MPYAVLLKEAHTLVDEIPEARMESVVMYLRNSLENKTDQMKAIFGIIPTNATLEDAKQERLGQI